jgi:transcriptional regulator with XRE-family HTH domain
VKINLPIKTTAKSIFDERYCTLIKNLVDLRIAKGFTQRTLAKALGVSNCYIARVETRERRLDLIETINFLRALDMSETEIEQFLQTIIYAKN